jgi:hypothetical protein
MLADVLVDPDENILVTELKHVGPAELYAEITTDGLGEVSMGISGKNSQIAIHGFSEDFEG